MSKLLNIIDEVSRLVKAGFPESTAKKIVSGELPMDFDSRMARAREQGYITDIDTVIGAEDGSRLDVGGKAPDVQHSPRGSDRPSQVRRSAREGAVHSRGFGGSARDGNPQTFLHGTSADSIRGFDRSHPDRKDLGWLGDGVYVTDSPELASQYAKRSAGGTAPNIIPLHIRANNLFGATFDDKQLLRNADAVNVQRWTDHLKNHGYDGAALKLGTDAREVMVMEPSQVRSIHAAFDPDQINNPNLLASAPAIGLLGLIGSDSSSADTIEAPKSESMAKLAQLMGDYNSHIEANPLLSLVAPEAPEDWARKAAYGDDISVIDRVFATLGMMP